ncbi:MAG TPA: DUF5050 domain-containing protein [Clostridiales bacterium]|nr:DUF5050 domain-containing protein [Clostridiales bacterium]
MFCKSCGTKIPDDSRFCFHCGESTVIPLENTAEEEKKTTVAAPKYSDVTAVPKFPEFSDYSEFSDIAEKDLEESAAAENESPYMTLPAEKKKPPQDKAKKSRLGLVFGLAGGITLLFLLLSLVLTITALSKTNTPFFDLQVDVHTESSNEIGNTAGNSLCYGIAAMQGDTIYYLHEASNIDEDKLKSIDLNGNNEQVYFTFDGDISDINVIGDQLFFVGDSYDADYNHVDSGVYVYDLYSDTLEEIYVTEDTIYNLYVHSDQIYFNVSTENGGDQILKADLDGFYVQTVLTKEDYIYAFAVFDDSIYYVYQETLYRCDFNGQHETEIYASPNTIDAYCVADDVIYIADHPEADRPVIKKLLLNGGENSEENEEDVIFLSEHADVWYLNVVEDTIYYIEVTTNENDETINSKICSLYTDGNGKQTLLSSKEAYYGLAICGPWLFSYDNNKMKTIKINISATASNSI